MKKTIIVLGSVLALVLAGTAGAALVPGVFDPGTTGCPVATYSGGVLHLEKNCPTATNAAAGADITGLAGQAFTSAAFTLHSAAQCNGGSPRFDIVTSDGTFFLGCNNVTPVVNGDGTRHVHLHRRNVAGRRPAGADADRNDQRRRRADRRPGHGRPDEHHASTVSPRFRSSSR